jgi:CubicO group peptidase (beta-lactamase class C family)
VAVVAAGGDWQLQWQQAIGAPLGITSIDWQGLGPTLNYRIAGGAQSNLRDYGRVLHLLLNEGVGNGRRLLGAGAIATMTINQSAGLPVLYLPPAATSSDYGLGLWIEAPVAPAAAPTVSSAGAFGFQPWIDFQTGFFAVFMIRGQAGVNALMRPAAESMIGAIRAELATGCTPVELFDRVFATGTDGE